MLFISVKFDRFAGCGRTVNSNIDIKDLLKKVDESDKMKDGD